MSESGSDRQHASSPDPPENERAALPEVTYLEPTAETVQIARQWASAIPAMQMTLICWGLLLAASVVLTVIACVYAAPKYLAESAPYGYVLLGVPFAFDLILLLVLNGYIGRIERFSISPTEAELDRAVRASATFWIVFLILSGLLLLSTAISFAVTFAEFMP